MRALLLLAGVTSVLTVAGRALPSHARSHTARLPAADCPTVTSTQRFAVVDLLTGKHKGFARARHGLPPTRAEDVRALTNPTDSTTCRRLLVAVLDSLHDHSLGGLLPGFFEAGNLYYVALTLPPQPPGRVRTGFVPFFVVDRKFRVVAELAM